MKKEKKEKRDDKGRARPCDHRWRECRPRPSEILKRPVPPFRECVRCYETSL